MRCIVIDNDAAANKQLSEYIGKETNLELAATFADSQEGFQYIQNGRNAIDIVFVEADMPGMSGIELMKSLMNKTAVVILSKSKNAAYDAYAAGCVDYLLKPYSYAGFKQAIAKAEAYVKQNEAALAGEARSAKFVSNNRFIFIKSEYKVMRINLDKIKYVESMREYVRFHIEDSRPIMSILTIKAVENYLPKDKFMRVHRSYIVNLDKIEIIERARIVFDGDTFIPVSEQYKEKFQAFLEQNFAQ